MSLSRRTFLAGAAGLTIAITAAAAAPAWALSLSSAMIGDVAVLSPRGKIIMGDGDIALRQAIAGTVNAGHMRIVLDMAGVTAMDSSGIGELVSSYTTVTNRGGRMVLANVPARVADILTITQLITVFEVYDSVDTAVMALRS